MIRMFGGGCGIAVFLLLLCAGAISADETDGSATALVKPLTHSFISQGFGCTTVVIEQFDAACPSRHWHSGVDLVASMGTPVFAIASGTATVIHSATGYGLHILIAHGSGISSLYGHLSEVDVVDGEDVVAGEVIGRVGSSGNSTGPHLHFEIRKNGVPENPMEELPLP